MSLRVPSWTEIFPLGVRRGEFELGVVWVAEGQHVQPHGRPGVLDLAVRHTPLVEEARRSVQVGARGDAEAEVVQPDAVLVETVAG